MDIEQLKIERTKKQTSFLKGMLKYYTKDVNRRCTEGTKCRYSPKAVGKEGISTGCAIGRWLNPELQVKLDGFRNCIVSNCQVFDLLPKNLRFLTQDFLVHVQTLHDSRSYWNKKGLSFDGEDFLKEIIRMFNLNPEQFKKWSTQNT